MEIYLLSKRGNFCTTGGQFCELPVTKPVVTQGTTRYESQAFFKKLNILKNDQVWYSWETQLLNIFIQMATVLLLREIEILSVHHGLRSYNSLNFSCTALYSRNLRAFKGLTVNIWQNYYALGVFHRYFGFCGLKRKGAITLQSY